VNRDPQADDRPQRQAPVVTHRREPVPGAVIINPMASGGAAAATWPQTNARLRHNFSRLERLHTEAPGHATILARRALESGAELIVAVGGDGTVNEVLQGFIDENGRNRFPNACLGIVHAGTGGDFQRMFGPIRAHRQVERLVRSPIKTIDYGFVRFTDNDGKPSARAFLNLASVGLSPEVAKEANRSIKLPGPLGYLIPSLKGIARYRNKQVLVRYDGGEDERVDLTLACVANGQYFGGGMWICPHSKLDDGQFDVLVVAGLARRHLIPTLAKVFRGKHLHSRGVDTSRAQTLHMEPVWRQNEVLLELDGEQVGRLPARFEIIRSSLRLRLATL